MTTTQELTITQMIKKYNWELSENFIDIIEDMEQQQITQAKANEQARIVGILEEIRAQAQEEHWKDTHFITPALLNIVDDVLREVKERITNQS